MDTNEQGGAFLRLRQEQRAVGIETASLRVFAREYAAILRANVQKIENDFASWQPDADWFCTDFRQAVKNAARYRELQEQDTKVRADIDRYEAAGL
jgi:hypothetical protein